MHYKVAENNGIVSFMNKFTFELDAPFMEDIPDLLSLL